MVGVHGSRRRIRSRPTWARGLKLKLKTKTEKQTTVAPYVGAWIETNCANFKANPDSVAPYVGAWIETSDARSGRGSIGVAPYVGAWIETFALSTPQLPSNPSRPTWARGLKQPLDPWGHTTASVAPYVGAWIETV